MATHQESGGLFDEELLQRLVTSHPERYGEGEAFWEFFAAQVGTRLPTQPVMIDLGCRLGLFFLNDWIRTPLQGYLASRMDRTENLDADRWRWFRLFPVHNKYTSEDW